MPLIEYTLDGRVDKVQKAIERIRLFDPSQSEYLQYLAPYYVCYSGGKDSDVLRILFELSGVKHELWHNHTTVDAPETVYYVRSIPGINISHPEITMWELIIQKRIPPLRQMRYCCALLKERGGQRRFIATGVRWAESIGRRAKRGSLEIQKRKANAGLILNADNANDRDIFEMCPTQGKRVLNPIVDWSDADVWEFLRHYGCKSNPLYECGFKRVGCLGCPMTGEKERRREFAMYPKYQDIYIHTFDRMIAHAADVGKLCTTWTTGQKVFDWWIKDPERQEPIDENQITLWEETT